LAVPDLKELDRLRCVGLHCEELYRHLFFHQLGFFLGRLDELSIQRELLGDSLVVVM
jgi:hypothetical protein